MKRPAGETDGPSCKIEVKVGPELAIRTKDHLVGGEAARQVEKYFMAVVDAVVIDPARAGQPDDISAWQWWSLHEMQETAETIYPLGLAKLIIDYLRSGPPATSIELAG